HFHDRPVGRVTNGISKDILDRFAADSRLPTTGQLSADETSTNFL
ncbi:MAG: hypothetical protein IPG22_06165, partial [Acidobacteria bacterium]|nr:hypothetical protein [Acidobacteriota bacterium]